MKDSDKLRIYNWAKSDSANANRLCAVLGIATAAVSVGVIIAIHFIRK